MRKKIDKNQKKEERGVSYQQVTNEGVRKKWKKIKISKKREKCTKK